MATSSTEREIRATRSKITTQRRRREFLLYGGAAIVFLLVLRYILTERSSAGSDG